MPDSEVKKKKTVENATVSAPTEIGTPKEGSDKDIRWYVIHTYSGYEKSKRYADPESTFYGNGRHDHTNSSSHA